ncbi:MAG: anthranilate synthase component I [Proteobacteria bacterium]|nr:MAG: anthranilate synthase component I [Pseudomonadota bacterium]
MLKETFQACVAQGYQRIPLVREVLADLDTPLSTYLKLANAPYSYLFESVQGGEKWGRYSIIGLPCRETIHIHGNTVEIRIDNNVTERLDVDDPLAWIEHKQNACKTPDVPELPRFTGGLVGYFGYETIGYIEPKLARLKQADPIGTPDILLMVSDEVVVFDNLSGKLYLVVHADADGYDIAQARLQALHEQLREPLSYPLDSTATIQNITEADFTSEFGEAAYKAAVCKGREYICDGDIMQVVLSQRLSIPFKASALDLYRSLRSLNPSPYMYFLQLDSFQIVGSSPEILVHLEANEVTVRPIAGTRKRGSDEAQDLQLEQDLLADPKELAEHLMLIDLGRNDAGRVSEVGSVTLTEKMCVERYSHVMHIVSNVRGELKKGMSAMDVLRATFPAGTVSGAPKIRAMEIIAELEPTKRGVYSGAVGYLSWSGNMDTAIAIRTAVIKDETLYIQAGAGVVYDSVPQSEWDETMNKARAIVSAVAQVNNGLDNIKRVKPI